MTDITAPPELSAAEIAALFARPTPSDQRIRRTAIALCEGIEDPILGLGLWALRLHRARVRRAAAANEEWAAIEARRRGAGRGTIFLSKEHGLSFTEYETQRRIEEELVPTPRWVSLYHWAKARRPSQILRRRVATVERGRRGFSERDLADFPHYLTATLARALTELADLAHGWPGDGEFPAMEDWTAALRENAAALAAYTEGDADGSVAEWYAAASDPGRQDEADDLSRARREREDARREAARAALVWVAEHFEHLWD